VQSIVVTAHKLAVETLIDRKVYSVTDDVQASFGTLSDVLSAIPSVDVDPDGNVSLRGDSNVLILIDGKPSTALGVAGLKSTTGVNAKLKLDYRQTSDDSAQLIVTRTDKRLTLQGYVSAINIVHVGYKRQIKPDLTGIVTVSDLFNGQRFERFESTPTFTGDYLRTVRGRVLYVGLIYSFGSTKKEKQANFEYDQGG
jgi:outer membrane receptor for ferrienterochelin and colicin